MKGDTGSTRLAVRSSPLGFLMLMQYDVHEGKVGLILVFQPEHTFLGLNSSTSMYDLICGQASFS